MTPQQVDEWFDSMRHDGHGAVRLMFFDGWSFERLDVALASARRNNVYVTITLDNGLPNCGEEEKTTEWFANSENRNAYALHMSELLTRYKGNNTIAWFEYFNEPSFADGALRTFYDEMGALADTIDPARLFSSGTLAPYALGGPQNFASVQDSPGVDIASLHEYDYNEAESHLGPQVLENSAGKPVIVGEFGVIDPTDDAQACLADAGKRVQRVQEKLSAYRTAGYIGAFAWAWQPGHPEDVCGSPGLDRDEAVQQVIRTAPPP
ncbi:cellulase family glycosylhydrolase [Nakamurella sp. GG22]